MLRGEVFPPLPLPSPRFRPFRPPHPPTRTIAMQRFRCIAIVRVGYYCIAIVLFVDAIVVFPFVFYSKKFPLHCTRSCVLSIALLWIMLFVLHCNGKAAFYCIAMELLFSIALQWNFCFLLHCNGTFLSVPIALQWYDFALDGSCNGRVCEC